MRSNRVMLCEVAALIGLASFNGCSVSPMSKRTAAFSTAAVATTQKTTKAYELVEGSYHDSQVAALVDAYEQDGFHPEKIQPFLSAEDMKVRTRVLEGLTKYAETLAEISSDQPLKTLDVQAAAFGKSLQTLSRNGEIKPLAKSAHISDTELNIVTTAVDALGRALIENRRRKDLPEVLQQMKEPVNQICELLEKDIGDPEKSGLRNELKNNYQTLIRKQEQFIDHNKRQMSAQEKRQEIQRLPQLVSEAQAADESLAATQKALAQLAKTHAALVESGNAKDSPGFRTLLAELIDYGQQLADFYQKLPAK